ncbi:MAG: hypothetical protein MZV70_40455 [Desulfobacterales bacterium]|nr:hypothetical protein [Desulfobacterales bacterium]
MGKYTMGAFYGGLEFAYITGDDPATTDKNEVRRGRRPGLGSAPHVRQLLVHQVPRRHGRRRHQSVANDAAAPASPNLIMFKPYVGWKVNPQLEVVACSTPG